MTVNVVDNETGLGVPLMWLETVSHDRVVTDSQGMAVFTQLELFSPTNTTASGSLAEVLPDEPAPRARTVFLSCYGPGYTHVQDALGYPGKAVPFTPGGFVSIKVTRKQPAERVYRLTGSGIFADSVVSGIPVPSWSHPLLNAGVVGQDSVQAAVHGARFKTVNTNALQYAVGFQKPADMN
jgi:hypothetical protein